MDILKTFLLILLLAGIPAIVSAQNNSSDHKIDVAIPQVALLGLVSDNSTIINTLSPIEAGNAVNLSENGQNNGIWINYSSVNRDNNHQRKVIAMVQGKLPNGIHLIVEASEAGGSGKGKLGNPVGNVTLSEQPSDVITEIGSCYTGKGVNNGHYLTYNLKLDKSEDYYAHLSSEQNSVNVIYTLTDQN